MAEQRQGFQGGRVGRRFNHVGRLCPVCFLPSGLAIESGLYHCRAGCGTWFRFHPETTDQPATLERVESPWLAGARIADDCRCPGCGARGHATLCSNCDAAARREAGR